VFAFVDTRGADVRKVGLEAVTAARLLADKSRSGEVHALLLGPPGISARATHMGQYGADVVIVAEHAGLANYSPEVAAATAADRIKSIGYRAAVFSTTAQGRDLAPRVAARLGVSLVTDVLSFEIEGDSILVRHPMNIGKVIATLAITNTPALISMRPNVISPTLNSRASRRETMQPTIDPASVRVKVIETRKGSGGKLDQDEATVNVARRLRPKAREQY